jgi:hypothetical protein
MPFVVLFLAMLMVHVFLPMNLLDDRYYTRMTEKSALFPYLAKTYGNWSSRLIILAVVRGMLGWFPSIVWRLLNPAAFALLGVLISRIIQREPVRKVNWFIAAALMIYPFLDMRSAGWVTTSINYLWVLTMGLYTIYLMVKLIRGEPVRVIAYLFAIPALLFAVNQEQMSVILLAVFATGTVILLWKKHAHWYPFAGLGISAAGLVFALLSPGNAARRVVEMSWFVDFNQLSLVDKLEIGISSTLDRFIFQPNLLFALLALLLVVSIFSQYQKPLLQVVSLIPLVTTLFFGIASRMDDGYLPYLEDISTGLTTHGYITLENYTQVGSYIPFIVLCGVMSIVLVMVYVAFTRRSTGWVAAGVLGLGFLARVMLGFSPTVWASAARTHIFFYAAILITCALLFKQVGQLKPQKADMLLVLAGFAGGFSFLNLLLAL